MPSVCSATMDSLNVLNTALDIRRQITVQSAYVTRTLQTLSPQNDDTIAQSVNTLMRNEAINEFIDCQRFLQRMKQRLMDVALSPSTATSIITSTASDEPVSGPVEDSNTIDHATIGSSADNPIVLDSESPVLSVHDLLLRRGFVFDATDLQTLECLVGSLYVSTYNQAPTIRQSPTVCCVYDIAFHDAIDDLCDNYFENGIGRSRKRRFEIT